MTPKQIARKTVLMVRTIIHKKATEARKKMKTDLTKMDLKILLKMMTKAKRIRLFLVMKIKETAQKIRKILTKQQFLPMTKMILHKVRKILQKRKKRVTMTIQRKEAKKMMEVQKMTKVQKMMKKRTKLSQKNSLTKRKMEPSLTPMIQKKMIQKKQSLWNPSLKTIYSWYLTLIGMNEM